VALALLRSISLESGAKPGCAVAAGACIDLVENDHRRILSLLFRHDPDREHDNDDGDELQQDAQPHQLLGSVGRAPAHHVDKAEQQHDGDGADRDRNPDMGHEIGHAGICSRA